VDATAGPIACPLAGPMPGPRAGERARGAVPSLASIGGRVTRSSELSDADAVALAREGDHAAYRVLVERYETRVYRLALRILRDEERARDASQDAFLKAYGALRRFEGRSSFYTWLYRLVYNLCLDLRRRDKSDRHVDWIDDSQLPGRPEVSVEPSDPDPLEHAERREQREIVALAIEALPDDARETLILREVEGLSYQEIADAMGIPKGTVMSRLHHARRRVREVLQEAGHSLQSLLGESVEEDA